MKMIVKVIFLLPVLLLTGCNMSENREQGAKNGTTVHEVINNQIEDTNQSMEGSNRKSNSTDEISSDDLRVDVQEVGDVDYDLTKMNSDMVYATVYQMISKPDKYVGKTVRVEGFYYAFYYEETGQYHHYCIIQDAMACCGQGMEFLCEDSLCVYPEEYADIVLEGTFEVYPKSGENNAGCRLANVTLIENKKE